VGELQLTNNTHHTMPEIHSIAVYCGSSGGSAPFFRHAATAVGRLLAQRSISLVYGGGRVGLMGAVADGALAAGGKVIGVIPTFLNTKELAHYGCTELFEVASMHERKAKMAELSQGFIAMPGGYGTLDELCEVLTWSQLGLHPWPIGILNLDGYFTPFLDCLDGMVQRGFLRPEDRSRLVVDTEIEPLLEKMTSWKQPTGLKWDDPQVIAAMLEKT
jgi:uncharacterized protein (TIGR00730 family)